MAANGPEAVIPGLEKHFPHPDVGVRRFPAAIIIQIRRQFNNGVPPCRLAEKSKPGPGAPD
jgi:hypothetical protein